MFTGIIEHLGTIEFLEARADGANVGGRISIHAPKLAPSLMNGEGLRAAMAGATLLCRTVYGAPCTIELLAGGTMVGRAGYANEDCDEGRWWVDGDIWWRQWRAWAYGEASGYRPLIEDGRVQWLNAEGLAVDQAAYIAPGADRVDPVDLAPHID